MESANCNSAASPRASILAGAGVVSPRGGVSHKRGVVTGSAWWRSDGIGTVGTDEAAGAGFAAVGGPGRGRGTRGGVLVRLVDGRAPPAGTKVIVDSRGCRTSCRCCTPASPGGDAVCVNPHMWPVCAKIAIISGGEREPSQDITFRAGQ